MSDVDLFYKIIDVYRELQNVASKLEDLKSAIGDIDTPDTLNYLIDNLNDLIQKQLSYGVIEAYTRNLATTYSPYLMDAISSPDDSLVILCDILSAPSLTIRIFDLGMANLKKEQTITLAHTLHIAGAEPNNTDFALISDKSSKFYILYFSSDYTNNKLVIEEFSVDSNYNITKTNEIITDVERGPPDKDLWGGAIIDNNTICIGFQDQDKSGIITIDLTTGEQKAFYPMEVGYIRSDGSLLYNITSSGDRIYLYTTEFILVTTITTKKETADRILYAFPDLAIYKNAIYVLQRGTSYDVFSKHNITMKMAKWWLDSSKTTDDIYNKLDSIGGNIGITNFPSWFTDSTKLIDDIITAINTQIDTKTGTIDSRLYNSTDAKSIYDHLKDVAGKDFWSKVSFDANNYLKINLSADDLGLKTAVESQQPRKIYGYDGSSWVPLKTTSEGKVLAVLG